ncbi:UDP-N-acetylglucosamine-1-phosphate transferase, putative [Eimeria necatrix]|uniref:UDP-N-acetylglucosamine--dolichyl-phosphate N-acetylglucosaminephosphotransferase n=1 Tax=Eimeria necatrix TaxID=51315 RepID=U6MGC4_9EIME|nr:UDP-N-acetylglucosamine-1-phosphate transferase, putative [Eimeria necatrix]CDJ63061.1 UDP-N-acetylglucosamine-1-phosphate transferase, putative [Eimeria necatrix]
MDVCVQLVEYPAALLGATWMGFLGFVDDALALPWRLKLLLPLLAASPIVAAYSGSTTVVLPCRVYTLLRDAWTGVAVAAAPAAANVAAAVELPIKHLVGALLLLMQQLCQWELQLRQIHSKLLSSIPAAAAAAAASAARCASLGLQQLSDLLHNVLHLLPSEPKLLTSSSSGSCSSGFWVLVDQQHKEQMNNVCIMSSMILGINGLEVGQSVVIASFVCIHNVIELSSHFGSVDAAKVVLAQQHFFSLVLCLPFLATSLALLKHNWYPSRVFVGDTYTCFALLGFVPCPRHRTPKYIPELGLLAPSPNFTLINLVLWIFGPMTEQRLLCILLLLQAACCAMGLLLRYYVCTFLLFA